MKTIINTLKIPVPRNWLLFSAASVWLIASVRVFMTAWEGILETQSSASIFILVSFLGSILFTRLVFRKVTAKYIHRIHSMVDEYPSLFSMFSIRSYLLIIFMISMGIGLKYSGIVPLNLLSMFLGVMGLSLFVSALNFLRAWRFSLLKTI
jgi:hypothetical protein